MGVGFSIRPGGCYARAIAEARSARYHRFYRGGKWVPVRCAADCPCRTGATPMDPRVRALIDGPSVDERG